MQSAIFVRPNLKGFLIGAAIVLMFHCVMQQIEGTTADLPRPQVPASVKQWDQGDFQAMLNHVAEHPTAIDYYKLGSYLEYRRDFKRAMIFLKKAEALAQFDDE